MEIDALGKPFDPAFHEALSKEEREGISAPVVVEIYQKGFTYNDKLLRPVLTKVAIPVAKHSRRRSPAQSLMAKNIGIDLGTTNSCISYLEGRETLIVPNPEGARVIPTVIAQTHDKKRIFGNAAKRQMITNSKNTVWGIKRLIGRKFDSPEIKEIGKRVGYDIVEAANGDIKVKLAENLYSTEEISGMFLGYLKNIAENYLGEAVGRHGHHGARFFQ